MILMKNQPVFNVPRRKQTLRDKISHGEVYLQAIRLDLKAENESDYDRLVIVEQLIKVELRFNRRLLG